jgi:hypothetical protein
VNCTSRCRQVTAQTSWDESRSIRMSEWLMRLASGLASFAIPNSRRESQRSRRAAEFAEHFQLLIGRPREHASTNEVARAFGKEAPFEPAGPSRPLGLARERFWVTGLFCVA